VSSTTPYATTTEATFEAFIAICPICGHRCVYHRAADLHDLRPIDLKRVRCQHQECGREFYINGDTISPAYRTLLFEAYEHRHEKRFRECLLNLGQALELLLVRIIYALLADQPFAHEHQEDWEALRSLQKTIKRKLHHVRFRDLRTAAISLISAVQHPLSTAEARELAGNLETLWGPASETQLAAAIDRVGNEELQRLLHRLRTTRIVTLRNRALHPENYRPSHEEMDQALAEARELILLLAVHLDPETDLFFEILHDQQPT
jgi:hypothetical protein